MQSIGGQLRAARESRGLSIPDIEHELRIPQGHLRDLEDDEYANFANLTYGRFFLSRYSDFLAVDTKEFQKEFTVPELGSINDYPYLQEPEEVLRGVGGKDTPKKLKPSARRAPTKASEQSSGQLKSAPLLIASCLGLLAMGALLVFMRDNADEFPEEATTMPAGEVEVDAAVADEDAEAPQQLAATDADISTDGGSAAATANLSTEESGGTSSGDIVSTPEQEQRPAIPAALPFNPEAAPNNLDEPNQALDENAVRGAIVDSRPPEALSSSQGSRGSGVNNGIETQLPPGAEPVAVPVPRAIPLN